METSNLWINTIVFFLTFWAMEWMAWFLHKYVMHGFLWSLHKDHHQPIADNKYQKNDLFSLVFAIPSFFLILFGGLIPNPILTSMGYGIMFYGFAYFFFHEVLIHRRFKLFQFKDNAYIKALNMAHKIHHANKEKKDGVNFGMLIVPIKYYKQAWNQSKKS